MPDFRRYSIDPFATDQEDDSVTNEYLYGDNYEDREGDRWRVGNNGNLYGVGAISHVSNRPPTRIEAAYGPLKLVSRNGVPVMPPERDTVTFQTMQTQTGRFTTADSGQREVYSTGMQRDTTEGKARFDLLVPEDVPYEDQFLTRFAELMERGARKYDERNWEKAGTREELARFKQSAFRHLIQWICGDEDEDHAAAVAFNLMAHETTKYKMESN